MVGNICLAYAVDGVFTKVYAWMAWFNGVLAFIVLIYVNYVIITKVTRSHKMFRNNEGQGEIKGQNKGHGHSNAAFSRREQNMKNTENQLTVMLILVTTLF